MSFSDRLVAVPLRLIGLSVLMAVWMIYYFLPRLSRDAPTRFEKVMMNLCSCLAVDLSHCLEAYWPVKKRRR